MPVWEFEADTIGAVVNGRTVRITGSINEAGFVVPGRDAHTFTFDILQLQNVMYEEDMDAGEALEAALARSMRDLRRSTGFSSPDVPAPPTAFPGFARKKILGNPRAQRGAPSP